MVLRRWFFRIVVGVGLLYSTVGVQAQEWSGFVAAEYRGFIQSPLAPEQHENYFSIALQPEYYHRIEDSKDSFTFVPFARVDQYDSERSHADIRELTWLKVGEGYEWRFGVRKVFWGTVESFHLVDIVNQTDLVENPDFEDKLGQPMINLALLRDWGALDIFVLPAFRERMFPGAEGRLRTIPRVDGNAATYDSTRKRRHVDYALRWAKSFAGVDVGLSYFTGTNRDPTLVPGLDVNGLPVFVPHYDLIRQTGLDLAATQGSWLWKLEAIHRSGQGASYSAAIGGFEYTFSGVSGTGADLGLLAEYLYDERGPAATTPFQNDVLAGVRLALNDEASSELLLGVITDRDSSARSFNLEASRRLGKSWKLSLEARGYGKIPATDSLYSLRRDDYVQLELARYF